VGKQDVEFEKELEKFEMQFKNISTPEQAVAAFKNQKKLFDDMAAKYEAIKAPAGLEEAHQKETGMIRKLSANLGDMINAIETKNTEKMLQALKGLDEIMSDEKTFLSIKQLQEFYFEGMHNKFSDLRRSADNIRVEMTKLGAELGVSVIGNINIEGW
jgi:hypothetical protein